MIANMPNFVCYFRCLLLLTFSSGAVNLLAVEVTTKTKALPVAPPKEVNVFASLPTHITLPALKADEYKPQALGKVVLPPQQLLLVDFFGGDIITKATKRSFALQPIGDKLSTRAWEIVITPEKKEEPPTLLAKLEIKENQLWFQWQPDAATQPHAPLLCNCLLQFSAGKSITKIYLRKPVVSEKLMASLTENSVVKWELTDLPETSRIKVECALGDKLPRHRFIGNAILKPSAGEAWVEFIEKEVGGMVMLKLETRMKPQFELRTTPYLVLNGSKYEYNEALYKRLQGQLQQSAEKISLQLKQVDAAIKDNTTKDKKKGAKPPAEIVAVQKQLTTQLNQTRASLAKLKGVPDFISKFDKKIAIVTKIYFESDANFIELLHSK
jgi:hypothetical protein